MDGYFMVLACIHVYIYMSIDKCVDLVHINVDGDKVLIQNTQERALILNTQESIGKENISQHTTQRMSSRDIGGNSSSSEQRWSDVASQICDQIKAVFSDRPTSLSDPSTVLSEEIARVAADRKRVFVHGVGREGLMLKAFCMRLFHLGLSAHVVGDVTTPPICPGDLLISSAGPGRFSTVDAICQVAKLSDARVVLVTAQPESGSYACNNADAIAYLPAQTMANDEVADRPSTRGYGGLSQVRLPMGSLYEGAMFVLFEMVVFRLAEALKQTPGELRTRHTNLE